MNNALLRIGCGAGFSGDRWDAAVPVVTTMRARGGPAVLMFETLAERTLALAQLQRKRDPDSGWEPSLDRFVGPVLRDCVEGAIPIVGSKRAAEPPRAGPEEEARRNKKKKKTSCFFLFSLLLGGEGPGLGGLWPFPLRPFLRRLFPPGRGPFVPD